ncbi:hypothetical protein TNCV_807461 [Trichonephila clavipes]|nr:hypothetical protein TNCV_807461 [Trichonephila clavipes]
MREHGLSYGVSHMLVLLSDVVRSRPTKFIVARGYKYACHWPWPSAPYRYKKCRVCFSHLITLRSIVLQRQSSDGQLGKLFTELYEMLQTLDR